jgi:outer membrane receptor for ferric coprogen and ferric-rhodotorulic acid
VDRYGCLLQDFASWNRWRLLAGARVDEHASDLGHHALSFSPRVGVACLLQPDFSLYGNCTIAEGPNFGYRDIQGDELTESWRAEQLEAGVKKRLFDNLWASLAVFQITQKNTPELDPSDPSGVSYICDGENRSRGFEAALNGELLENWEWWGSYTYLDYEDVDAGLDFARYPRNSLALWTAYRLPCGFLQGLRVAIGYRYTDTYYTTFRGAYVGDDYVIEPAHVVDVECAYPLKWLSRGKYATRLEAGVKNVFDETYVESNRHGTENFPGAPRAVWVRVCADF